MTTMQTKWDEVKTRSRIRRINEMVAFHRQRMIEWPSIDGNAKRMAEISKLNDELAELQRMVDGEENQTDANARLIAAAPEMLDALRRLTHPMASDDDLENALAVIAKVEGGNA